MSDKEEHKRLLSEPFEIEEAVSKKLSPKNAAAVKKYGSWMNALETGAIQPITDEQRRFLEVCKGFQNPINEIEVAWYNFKKVVSRVNGGDFGYHSIPVSGGSRGPIEKCNACGRNISFCVCGQ